MEEIKNIRLVLQYDGSRYHGWQRQSGFPTVQATVEEKIHLMTRESITLIASGRTDAGVHALNQVCNFITRTRIDPDSIHRGLNALLPDDIHVRGAAYVPVNFHSRYSAKSKTYEYRILNQGQRDVFLRRYAWHVGRRLDTSEIEKCLSLIRGMQDFSSFRSSGSGDTNPVREMLTAELHGTDGAILRFVFEADGFLRHMVRNMVGTLVEVGQGKMGLDQFMDILQSRDRRRAGVKAPPQGLFLAMVRYK